MNENDFEPPGVFIKGVCKRILNQIFSDYHVHSVSHLRKIADDMSYIPEFLGYETYLMLNPEETRQAEKVVDILLPFHIGMLLIDEVVDRNVAPSPELYLAVDLIRRCEENLLAVLHKSSRSYVYDYYLKMLSILQQASFERETLRENCSLSEYMCIIEKLSSPYMMCTVVPAMIAGVTDEYVLDILGNYARDLYVAFHILDDIRDLEEDKKAHRPNFVTLSGSKKKAYKQYYSRLTSASDYIESVDISNFHKEYVQWLTTFLGKSQKSSEGKCRIDVKHAEGILKIVRMCQRTDAAIATLAHTEIPVHADMIPLRTSSIFPLLLILRLETLQLRIVRADGSKI